MDIFLVTFQLTRETIVKKIASREKESQLLKFGTIETRSREKESQLLKFGTIETQSREKESQLLKFGTIETRELRSW